MKFREVFLRTPQKMVISNFKTNYYADCEIEFGSFNKSLTVMLEIETALI